MDKRVESLQADCLDGGSTPPSSTKKERTFGSLFFCRADASIFTFLLELYAKHLKLGYSTHVELLKLIDDARIAGVHMDTPHTILSIQILG